MAHSHMLLVVVCALTSACALHPSRAAQSAAPYHAAPAMMPSEGPRPSAQVARLVRWLPPTPAAARCAPVEIGHGRWITPLCASMPAVEVRSFAGALAFEGAPAPLHVDLRTGDLAGPVLDQGRVGVCWAFALSTVMNTGARKVGHRDALIAPLHVVAKHAWHEAWHGGPSSPFALEATWPYEERKACAFNRDAGDDCGATFGVAPGSWQQDPTLRAELDGADREHRFRFDGATQLEASPANVDQLARALADGDAIWAAFRFARAGWHHDAVRDGVFEDYAAQGGPSHAVALVGYRTTAAGKQFLIKNSWGVDWGQGGYAWMPERVLRKHMYRAFRLEVSATRAAEPKRPPPALACEAGQLRDLVTGACSLPCAGIFPPFNGVCGLGMPAATASTACAAGQVRDPITAMCSAPCGNGFAPLFGICVQ